MSHTSPQDPRRILWLYHQANTFGGSLSSLLEILDRRDRTAFEVVAALPGPGTCADEFARRGARSVFLAEHRVSRTFAYARSVLSFVRLLRRERIDLLYIADYITWRSSAVTAAVLTRTPYVVHLRSPLPDDARADPWILRAPAVIGNSRATLRALEGQVPPERMHVIYNFVDFERLAGGRDIRHEFFGGRPRVVGFVGFFRPEKGIEYFLEMAALVRSKAPDVRYLAVGSESTVKDVGWFQRMKDYARELGVDDVVHFAGARRDIPDVMRSLDILVVPSLNEGFGRVIIEANAVGVPVIGANAAGIPEVIEDGITGRLVPPRDSQAMAAAVLEIFDDEDWRRRVAATVPERVSTRFSPERQVRTLEDVWRRVTGRPLPGPTADRGTAR